MRFRITYSGELKSAGKSTRAAEKDVVRRYISPQLKELSTAHPAFHAYGLEYWPQAHRSTRLEHFPVLKEIIANVPTPDRVHVSPGHYDVGIALTEHVEVKGRKYVPIVRTSLATTCGLDILFLRKGDAGSLVSNSGDLDNRIKVLFDGLRVPKPNEIEPPVSSEEEQDVTFCLLEDDALITDFTVRSDRLLTRPDASDSEVLLVIDVVVKVSHLTSNNLGFLSD